MSVNAHFPQQDSVRLLLIRPDHRSWFPAALYLLFAMADLFFSLIAFRFGIAEGNPFMAWLVVHGLFIPGKILLTLLVTGLMVVIYSAARRWHWTIWSGVALMGGVVAYHLWALPQIVGSASLASLL